MTATLPNVAYIVASFLFIMSLKGLSMPSSSRRGNLLGAIGMILAIVVTTAKLWAPEAGLTLPSITSVGLLAGAIAVGCVIGAVMAAGSR
jgi:NAD(P) transhydrogenase subunit beta